MGLSWAYLDVLPEEDRERIEMDIRNDLDSCERSRDLVRLAKNDFKIQSK